jgi:hypothetical protein
MMRISGSPLGRTLQAYWVIVMPGAILWVIGSNSGMALNDIAGEFGASLLVPFYPFVRLYLSITVVPQGLTLAVTGIAALALFAIPSIAASRFNKAIANLSAPSAATLIRALHWRYFKLTAVVALVLCALAPLEQFMFGYETNFSIPMLFVTIAFIVAEAAAAIWTIRDFPKRVAPISASQVTGQ